MRCRRAGAGEAMALREEEEGGERNGGEGDRPVAANLRVVRGLLVLADSPPPRRRRAHAVVAEAAGLRPHPYAAQAKPCLIARPVARGNGPANTVLPVVAPPPRARPAACRCWDNETTERGGPGREHRSRRAVGIGLDSTCGIPWHAAVAVAPHARTAAAAAKKSPFLAMLCFD